MTTASNGKRSEDVEFTTAREFYTRQREKNVKRDGPPYAKAVIWYDQATPVFACLSCFEAAKALEYEGEKTVNDWAAAKSAANRFLMDASPRCDVCTNQVREKVEGQ